jgi:hypothetical protein
MKSSAVALLPATGEFSSNGKNVDSHADIPDHAEALDGLALSLSLP